MNEIMQQIVNACVSVLCLLITAGGAYLVVLIRKKTAQEQQELDNAQASKYMDMACEAVTQAVTYTAQTFVDTLKAEGAFTKEKQLEAFQRATTKVYEILGNTTVKALEEIYGDFDAWLVTRIEQVCREIKTPTIDTTVTAATTAATAASVAVQQLAVVTSEQHAETAPESQTTE